MIQPVGGRRGQKSVDGGTAGRHAEDGHIIGVTTIIGDVIPHPGQRQDLVTETVGHGPGQGFVVLRQIEKTKHAKPIIDGNHHHVALGSKNRAVVVVTRTDIVGAAVNPEQHRPGATVRCGV